MVLICVLRFAAMLRAAFVPLCLLMFTMFKVTNFCLDDPDVRHALLAAVVHRKFYLTSIAFVGTLSGNNPYFFLCFLYSFSFRILYSVNVIFKSFSNLISLNNSIWFNGILHGFP